MVTRGRSGNEGRGGNEGEWKWEEWKQEKSGNEERKSFFKLKLTSGHHF